MSAKATLDSAAPPSSPNASSNGSSNGSLVGGSKTADNALASSFYSASSKKNLDLLCNMLRSTGPPVKEAVLRQGEKRVYYLKGERLLNFLVAPKMGRWDEKLPRVQGREEAIKLCRVLLDNQYLHQVDKLSKQDISMVRQNVFEEDQYYVWVYEGSSTKRNTLTVVLIVVFLLCVCFPLWPAIVKVWVWYISVTLLLILTFLICVRALTWLVCWSFIGYDVWIIPNLFDEELGVADSFKPIYTIEKSKSGQIYWRIGILVGVLGFCYYAVSCPSEFEGMVASQKSFLDDLYSGNLIADVSQQSKDDIDKPRMKSLDDLLQELDAEDVEEEDKTDAILDMIMDEDEKKDEDGNGNGNGEGEL